MRFKVSKVVECVEEDDTSIKLCEWASKAKSKVIRGN